MLDTRKNIQRHYYNFDKKEKDDEPAWDTDFGTIEPEIPKDDFTGCDRVVFVQGLPQLDTGSREHASLNNKLMDHFDSYGRWDSQTFYHPFEENEDGDSISKGFCFVEFSQLDSAETFIEEINGCTLTIAGEPYKVTANNIDMFNVQQKLKYKATKREDFSKWSNFKTWWLMEDAKDYRFRDQYLIRYRQGTGDKVKHQCEVFWNDVLRAGRVVTSAGKREMEEGKHMTHRHVMWSPLGAYLVTFHDSGILLWAGSDWSTFARFSHQHASYAQFSPRETFMISYSMDNAINQTEAISNKKKRTQVVQPKKKNAATRAIHVWNIKEQKSKRPLDAEWSFEYGKWPMFKWSHDEKFFARMGSSKWPESPNNSLPDGLLFSDKITIYESSTMKKLNKRSFQTPWILDFTWRPAKENTLVYVTREVDATKEQIQQCASIIVNKVTEGGLVQIRKKRIFNVDNTGIEMYWHPDGDALAVKVSHYENIKKFKRDEVNWVNRKLYHDIELVMVNVKQNPITNLSLSLAEAGQLAWEPNDSGRFAVWVLHQQDGPMVNIFKVENDIVRKLISFPAKPCNHLSWSPIGRYLMVAGFRNSEREILIKDWGMKSITTGTLEFYDVDAKKSLMQTAHSSMTGLHWSPCGQYVVTSVCQEYVKTSNSESSDCGYTLWTFQGEVIKKYQYNQLLQFLWRPRPPSKLDHARRKEIMSSKYKQHKAKFQQIDYQISQELVSDEQKYRKQKRDWWKELTGSMKEWADEIASTLAKALGIQDSKAYVYTTETVQETIQSSKTQVTEAEVKKVADEEIFGNS